MLFRSTKKSSNAKGSQGEGSLGFNPPTTALPKLDEVLADKPDTAFVDYVPARTFARGDLVSHAKFGRGCVVATEAGRVEILFTEGVKKLAHGVS